MKKLYYLSFNNYYNRLVKREETITDYLAKSTLCGAISTVNFFPNDGISTQHTPYLNDIEKIPDYLVVANEDDTIHSRWFVMECRYNAGKTQYICNLYRDLIAEYWPTVVDKPFFCEKGGLSVLDNGIFNDEAILTSQIKTNEITISDATNCPWIVGYYALPEAGEQNRTVTFTSTTITPDVEVNGIENWQYYDATGRWVDDWNLNYFYRYNRLIFDDEYWIVPFKPGVKGTAFQVSTPTEWGTGKSPSSFGTDIAALSSRGTYPTTLQQRFSEYTGLSFDNAAKDRLLSLEGRIIKDTATGAIYQVHVTSDQQNVELGTILPTSPLGTTMREMLGSGGDEIMFSMSGNANEYNFRYSSTFTVLKVTLINALLDSGSIVISTTRRPLYDAPYAMFAIPYGTLTFTKNYTPLPGAPSVPYSFTTSEINGINIATAIAEGAGLVYDVQLLPYCPVKKIREYFETAPIGPGWSFSIDDQNLVEGQDYSIANNDQNKPIQVLFWCDVSSDSFIVESIGKFKTASMPTDAIDFKVGCQTEFIRLCSPNYNGVFEINPYKNRGIDYFTVSYTYKPYQPFIQLSPNFKALYGKDYNDARGLILGGDFSLPIINDQWQSYEIQNKNYQAMFNRQIDNMEVQHKYQRREQIAGAIMGTVTGGVTGGVAGASTGGGIYGAIAGAAVGAIGSGVGGYLDYTAGEALRAEALDYTKDLFGYQLDNIKALPNSLTRVSAYNIKNKIFPFIEVYDCTPEEKEAVRNKIIYNGMTVERIGKIEQFIGQERQYVKGQLIRFEDLTEDTHVLTTLSNELYKGVFV